MINNNDSKITISGSSDNINNKVSKIINRLHDDSDKDVITEQYISKLGFLDGIRVSMDIHGDSVEFIYTKPDPDNKPIDTPKKHCLIPVSGLMSYLDRCIYLEHMISINNCITSLTNLSYNKYIKNEDELSTIVVKNINRILECSFYITLISHTYSSYLNNIGTVATNGSYDIIWLNIDSEEN